MKMWKKVSSERLDAEYQPKCHDCHGNEPCTYIVFYVLPRDLVKWQPSFVVIFGDSQIFAR